MYLFPGCSDCISAVSCLGDTVGFGTLSQHRKRFFCPACGFLCVVCAYRGLLFPVPTLLTLSHCLCPCTGFFPHLQLLAETRLCRHAGKRLTRETVAFSLSQFLRFSQCLRFCGGFGCELIAWCLAAPGLLRSSSHPHTQEVFFKELRFGLPQLPPVCCHLCLWVGEGEGAGSLGFK